MKGYSRCSNGHFYKEDLNACPHCNIDGTNTNLEKTKMNTVLGSDFDKTQVFQKSNSENVNTQFTGGSQETNIFGNGKPSSSGEQNLDRTYIGGVIEDDSSGQVIANEPRSARKIVGWLVSFTLDPMGVDYRIYEGNNSIGKDNKNSITITSDNSISGEHVNILFRRGLFHIKDKMTTNGTFLNSIDMEVEKAYELKDGDEVKMGNTVFIFKTWY